jgi:hypothetical protein
VSTKKKTGKNLKKLKRKKKKKSLNANDTQFGAGLDVVGDVSDVHADLEVSVGQCSDVQRVVEVFGGQRIDGEDAAESDGSGTRA